MTQLVKNLLTVQEINCSATDLQLIWIPSLDQEDPLEKEMVTHCSVLAWRIPWTEELGGLYSMGLQIVWAQLRRFCTLFHLAL